MDFKKTQYVLARKICTIYKLRDSGNFSIILN